MIVVELQHGFMLIKLKKTGDQDEQTLPFVAMRRV